VVNLFGRENALYDNQLAVIRIDRERDSAFVAVTAVDPLIRPFHIVPPIHSIKPSQGVTVSPMVPDLRTFGLPLWSFWMLCGVLPFFSVSR
jgi:hypothetical protein